MKTIFVLPLFLILPLVLQSQPSNDLCQNAIELSVTEAFDPLSVFDLTGATSNDPDAGGQLCYIPTSSNTIKDVWFKVVVPADGYLFIEIDARFYTVGTNFGLLEPVFEAYTGGCSNLQSVTDQLGNCHWKDTHGLYYEGTPNEELFIRVFDDEFDEEDVFSISAIATNESNNQDCVSATTLDIGESCELRNFSTNNADPYNWFKFVYPAKTDYLNLQLYTRSFYKSATLEVDLYLGSCESLTLIDTYSAHFSGILIHDVTPGETVYIRVSKHFSYDGLPFGICLFHKENDVCSGATELLVNADCQPIGFSTLGSSQSQNPTENINCGYYPNKHDVWLKATIPASGNITFEFSNFDLLPGTSTTTAFEFYSGSCSSLNAVYCDGNEFRGGQNETRIIRLTDLPPNQTLYIRIMNADGYKQYLACAYEESFYNQTCQLNLVKFLNVGPCDPETNTVPVNFEAHFSAPEGSDIDLFIAGNQIPLNSNPQQFTINVPSLGQVFSHQVTRIEGDCFSNYYRHFNVFSAPNSCFSGTIQNDECVDAIVLDISTNCASNPIYEYIDATISDPDLSYTCSSAQEKEIWFSFTPSTSNELQIYLERLSGHLFSPYLDIYTGPCTDLTPIDNPACDRGYPSNNAITLSNLPIGEQVFIRVLNCCPQGQGAFKICLIEACPPEVDVNKVLENHMFLYRASDRINGTELIRNGAEVVFQGSQAINLMPGFEVKLSSIFEANLDGCN